MSTLGIRRIIHAIVHATVTILARFLCMGSVQQGAGNVYFEDVFLYPVDNYHLLSTMECVSI